MLLLEKEEHSLCQMEVKESKWTQGDFEENGIRKAGTWGFVFPEICF